jgi:CRP-like cAMP-binding protein
MFASTPQDLSALIQAMTTSVATDTAQNVLSAAQWELLAPYLQPINLAASEVLFAEGALDRNLYLVEYGSLSVHYQDSKERIRLALVGPGAIVGEGPSSPIDHARPRCRPQRPAVYGV